MKNFPAPRTEIDNHGRLEVGATVMSRFGRTGIIKEMSPRKLMIRINWHDWHKDEWIYPHSLLSLESVIMVIPQFRVGDVVTCDDVTWIVDAIAGDSLYLKSLKTSSPRVHRLKQQCQKIACTYPLCWPDENINIYQKEYCPNREILYWYYEAKFWLETRLSSNTELSHLLGNEDWLFNQWSEVEASETFGTLLSLVREEDFKSGWSMAFKHKIQQMKENQSCDNQLKTKTKEKIIK